MSSNSKRAVRLAFAHLSAATTIFLAGVAAVSKGWIIRGLILMAIAVLYLIYELATSRPVTKNVPGMFRLLIAIFAVSIFAGINRDTIKGFFGTAPTPTPTPSPYGEVTLPTRSPSPRRAPYRKATPLPSPTPENPIDRVIIVAEEAIGFTTNDQERTIQVPVILKNFGKIPTQGTVEPYWIFEDREGHKDVHPDHSRTLSMVPGVAYPYTFFLTFHDQADYARITAGDAVITRVELKFSYPATPGAQKLTVFRLTGTLQFKTHQLDIEYLGSE